MSQITATLPNGRIIPATSACSSALRARRIRWVQHRFRLTREMLSSFSPPLETCESGKMGALIIAAVNRVAGQTFRSP